MNNTNPYIKEADIEPAVVAIAEDEGQLKAVMLRKKDGVFELVRMASRDSAETDWQGFATEFIGQAEDEGDIKLVIGYGSAGMIFYRIDLPVVKEEELAALVRMQAEVRFPLPIEEMAFVCQVGKREGKHCAVTIAAARKDQLKNFVAEVSSLKPAKIILNYEGIVKAWKEFFSIGKQDGVVLNIGQFCTEVCQIEDGRLRNVASLDIGTNDFLAGMAGAVERFNQDMKSVLEMFGFSDGSKVPVYVLSDGRAEMEDMALCLKSAGFNVETVLPKVEGLSSTGEIGDSDIYEYRVAIGLAAMSFETADEDINIFEGLYCPTGKAKSRLYSLKKAWAVAIAMFILLVIVCYFIDVRRLRSLEKRFSSSEGQVSCSILLEQQKIIKEVAMDRPDLMALLSQICSEENNGVLLDGFHYKKGQPITISGQVNSDDQLYKFQESLMSKKGLSKVRIQKAKKENKGNKLYFSLMFDYKNFTKKK